MIGSWLLGGALHALVLVEGVAAPQAAPVELCSGERFRLLLLTQRQEAGAFAYVLLGREGQVQRLLPEEGERLRLRPGLHTLPEEEDQFFDLDDRAGVELLLLISSKVELSSKEVERVAREALNKVPVPALPAPGRVCAAKAAAKGGFAPEGQLERYRGVVLRRGSKGGTAGLTPVVIQIVHR